jgi:hypothetical protein
VGVTLPATVIPTSTDRPNYIEFDIPIAPSGEQPEKIETPETSLYERIPNQLPAALRNLWAEHYGPLQNPSEEVDYRQVFDPGLQDMWAYPEYLVESISLVRTLELIHKSTGKIPESFFDSAGLLRKDLTYDQMRVLFGSNLLKGVKVAEAGGFQVAPVLAQMGADAYVISPNADQFPKPKDIDKLPGKLTYVSQYLDSGLLYDPKVKIPGLYKSFDFIVSNAVIDLIYGQKALDFLYGVNDMLDDSGQSMHTGEHVLLCYVAIKSQYPNSLMLTEVDRNIPQSPSFDPTAILANQDRSDYNRFTYVIKRSANGTDIGKIHDLNNSLNPPK